MQVQSLSGVDPWEKRMATHSSILACKIHGHRNLVGYNPWGHKESDTTEHTRRSSMQKISKETGDWNNIKNYKQRWAQERTEMVWS